LKSQKIIKWVFYNKKKTINQLKWTFQVKCKNIVTVALEKSQLIPKSNVETYVEALCGKSLHTHNSQPFFNEIELNAERMEVEDNLVTDEPMQLDLQVPKQLPANSFNQPSVNNFNKNKIIGKQFPCNDTCRKTKYDSFISNGLENCYLRIHESTLGTLSDFLDKLFTCTNPNRDERNGHSKECYLNEFQCGARILSLLKLLSHFPELRNIKSQLYEIRRLYTHLSRVDEALEQGDVAFLKKIGGRHSSKSYFISQHCSTFRSCGR